MPPCPFALTPLRTGPVCLALLGGAVCGAAGTDPGAPVRGGRGGVYDVSEDYSAGSVCPGRTRGSTSGMSTMGRS